MYLAWRVADCKRPAMTVRVGNYGATVPMYERAVCRKCGAPVWASEHAAGALIVCWPCAIAAEPARP